jgi:hypothetical protein
VGVATTRSPGEDVLGAITFVDGWTFVYAHTLNSRLYGLSSSRYRADTRGGL